ncbi:MAG: hypothetical protein AB1445_01185 [Bacillota bacterium]
MIRETYYAVGGHREVLHGEESIQAALNQLAGVRGVEVDQDKTG